MIGDLLLTANHNSVEKINLPHIEDINERLEGKVKFHATGLTQKIQVLSPNRILCWADDYYCTRQVVEKLVQDKNKMSAPDLHSFLQELPPEIGDQIALIVATHDGNSVSVSNHGCKTINHEQYGEMFVSLGRRK